MCTQLHIIMSSCVNWWYQSAFSYQIFNNIRCSFMKSQFFSLAFPVHLFFLLQTSGIRLTRSQELFWCSEWVSCRPCIGLDPNEKVVELSSRCVFIGLWQPCSVADLLIIPTRSTSLSLSFSLSFSFQFIQNRIIYIKSLRQITVGGSNLYLIEN